MSANTSPIVDAHVHVWSADCLAYPPRSGLTHPAFDAAAERLLSLMDARDVTRVIAVQTPWYGEDNRYLSDVLRRWPDRFADVGVIDKPLSPGAADVLAAQYAAGLRGVRLQILHPLFPMAQVGALVSGAAGPLFARAAALTVPVELLYLDQALHAPLVAILAARFPDLTLIVDHLGHLDPDPQAHPGAWDAFFALARFPRVYVKLSRHNLNSRQAYPWRDSHPIQERALAANDFRSPVSPSGRRPGNRRDFPVPLRPRPAWPSVPAGRRKLALDPDRLRPPGS